MSFFFDKIANYGKGTGFCCQEERVVSWLGKKVVLLVFYLKDSVIVYVMHDGLCGINSVYDVFVPLIFSDDESLVICPSPSKSSARLPKSVSSQLGVVPFIACSFYLEISEILLLRGDNINYFFKFVVNVFW